MLLRRGGRVAAALALALIVACVGLGGCSDSEPRPRAVDLVKELGILHEQQGYSAAQIRCVADFATRAFGTDADLRRFRDELVELNRTKSTGAMTNASRTVLTKGIGACAVEGSGG